MSLNSPVQRHTLVSLQAFQISINLRRTDWQLQCKVEKGSTGKVDSMTRFFRTYSYSSQYAKLKEHSIPDIYLTPTLETGGKGSFLLNTTMPC